MDVQNSTIPKYQTPVGKASLQEKTPGMKAVSLIVFFLLLSLLLSVASAYL